MENSKVNIGLFGFGTVGEGLYNILKTDSKYCFRNICVKNENKKRSVDISNILSTRSRIINNSNINLIVELIDDCVDSYEIVKSSLLKGKNVVSANKKMIAYNLKEIINLQKDNGGTLLYEASSCGSIPIIKCLEESYGTSIESISGIFNGSSNYILSKLFSEDIDYEYALNLAQERGFAESNPISDVGGFDSLYKLVIISYHAFGVIANPDDICVFGISNITIDDVKFAKKNECKIKLIASSRIIDNKICMSVFPKLIPSSNDLYSVENEYNAVLIDGKYFDNHYLSGKGAGAKPTSAAVISDIVSISKGYRYSNCKIDESFKLSNEFILRIYLRFNSKEDIAAFNFVYTIEIFNGSATNYIIGDIYISDLFLLKQIIEDNDLFIMSLEDVNL